MKRGFTGIKDVDSLILLKLPLEDLTSACSTDTFVSRICDRDEFWFQRLLQSKITGDDAEWLMIFWGFETPRDLTEYLEGHGKDASKVALMALDEPNIIDAVIDVSLDEQWWKTDPEELDYEYFIEITRKMRREIPRLILTQTDVYLFFHMSTIQRAFDKKFITIRKGTYHITVPVKYLNKKHLKSNYFPVRANGLNEDVFIDLSVRAKNVEKKWADFEKNK